MQTIGLILGPILKISKKNTIFLKNRLPGPDNRVQTRIGRLTGIPWFRFPVLAKNWVDTLGGTHNGQVCTRGLGHPSSCVHEITTTFIASTLY
jgi:hypothetical protein